MGRRIILGAAVLVFLLIEFTEGALVTYTFDTSGSNTSGFIFDPDGVGGAPSVLVTATVGDGLVETGAGTFFVTSDSDFVTKSTSGLGVHWEGSIAEGLQPFADLNPELDGYLPEMLQFQFADDVSLVSATVTHSHTGAAPSGTAVVVMDGSSLAGYSEAASGQSVMLDFSALSASATQGSLLTFETPVATQPSANDYAYRLYSLTVQYPAVPEPTSLALWSGLGFMGLIAARRRRRTA